MAGVVVGLDLAEALATVDALAPGHDRATVVELLTHLEAGGVAAFAKSAPKPEE